MTFLTLLGSAVGLLVLKLSITLAVKSLRFRRAMSLGPLTGRARNTVRPHFIWVRAGVRKEGPQQGDEPTQTEERERGDGASDKGNATNIEYDQYVKALPRGARRTLAAVDKSLAKHGIEVRTTSSNDTLTQRVGCVEVFALVYAHEFEAFSAEYCRSHGQGGKATRTGSTSSSPSSPSSPASPSPSFLPSLKAKLAVTLKTTFVSVIRTFILLVMTGTHDEYRSKHTNRLIGLTSTIIKGDTLRGMWFYLDPAHKRHHVWFHSIRTALQRAFATEGVLCVDLGPSATEVLSDLKAKFGFSKYEDWQAVCDYSGPWRAVGASGVQSHVKQE